MTETPENWGEMPDDGTKWPQPPSPSEQLLRFFTYEHLPPDLRPVSQACADLATWMQATLPDGPEKTTGLRKLLEAKDAFVRAALPSEPPERKFDRADADLDEQA